MTNEIETLAKPLVSNQFWILMQNGEKVGVLNKIKSKYIISTKGEVRAEFPSKKKLLDNIPIKFIIKGKDSNKIKSNSVHGFPINTKKYYSSVFDVTRALPMFTKKDSSTCWFGAGYYILFFDKIGWTIGFCPKIITLDRYAFKGPFMSRIDAREGMKLEKSAT